MLNRKSLLLISVVLGSSLIIGVAPGLAGNGFLGAETGPSTGAAGMTPASGQKYMSGSMFDSMKSFFQSNSPPTGEQEEAKQQQQMDGSDEAQKYPKLKQGGMKESENSLPDVEGQKPNTVAKKANKDQEPSPNFDNIAPSGITIYQPFIGKWGPPSGQTPFFYFPPDPTKMMAPASPKLLGSIKFPKGITNGAGFQTDAQRLLAAAAGAYQGAQEEQNPSMGTSQAKMQGRMQQAGKASNSAAQQQFNSNMETIRTNLINVANEAAGTPTRSDAPQKTLNQAIWMVQQMFKGVFLPMAILFLLPGAVLTQAMSVVKGSVIHAADEDTNSPFSGMLRGMVALFLIPATQLIVSYSIDVGNSMTYQVTQYIQMGAIEAWAEGMYNPEGNQTPKQAMESEGKQTGMQAMQRTGFGMISQLLNYGLMVLCAYQVVIVCYLFLLGPIAACFMAWPGGIGKLFRPVFSNWLEGLLNLVLWRFWWCVILLCMATRINWLMEMGQYDPQGPWEPIFFICFSVMLTYIPFMALDFRPGDMVDELLKKTDAMQGGGGKAGHGHPHQHGRSHRHA